MSTSLFGHDLEGWFPDGVAGDCELPDIILLSLGRACALLAAELALQSSQMVLRNNTKKARNVAQWAEHFFWHVQSSGLHLTQYKPTVPVHACN